ncbi:MAG: hypothetical protein ACKPKO_46190, partial [Candidatus Fonsibacter sp.]
PGTLQQACRVKSKLNHLFTINRGRQVVQKGLQGHHMFAQKQHNGSGCLGFSDTDNHNFPLVSNPPGPKNQHPGSARLGFPNGSGSVVIINNGGIKTSQPSLEIAGQSSG